MSSLNYSTLATLLANAARGQAADNANAQQEQGGMGGYKQNYFENQAKMWDAYAHMGIGHQNPFGRAPGIQGNPQQVQWMLQMAHGNPGTGHGGMLSTPATQENHPGAEIPGGGSPGMNRMMYDPQKGIMNSNTGLPNGMNPQTGMPYYNGTNAPSIPQQAPYGGFQPSPMVQRTIQGIAQNPQHASDSLAYLTAGGANNFGYISPGGPTYGGNENG